MIDIDIFEPLAYPENYIFNAPVRFTIKKDSLAQNPQRIDRTTKSFISCVFNSTISFFIDEDVD